jgi:hypothetical protein
MHFFEKRIDWKNELIGKIVDWNETCIKNKNKKDFQFLFFRLYFFTFYLVFI